MSVFTNLLGKNRNDAEFIALENSFKGDRVLRENNIIVDGKKRYDYELLYKEDGILITFLADNIIAIKAYFMPTPICKPFFGVFVLGLSYISSENEIKKQFNFPKNLNQEPMRADNIYQHENCTVAFDAMTAEIKFAEIR